MTSDVESLVLEQLRHLQAGQDRLDKTVTDLVDRTGRVELRLANVEVEVASLSVRIDKVSSRVERIERRLDLVEAP